LTWSAITTQSVSLSPSSALSASPTVTYSYVALPNQTLYYLGFTVSSEENTKERLYSKIVNELPDGVSIGISQTPNVTCNMTSENQTVFYICLVSTFPFQYNFFLNNYPNISQLQPTNSLALPTILGILFGVFVFVIICALLYVIRLKNMKGKDKLNIVKETHVTTNPLQNITQLSEKLNSYYKPVPPIVAKDNKFVPIRTVLEPLPLQPFEKNISENNIDMIQPIRKTSGSSELPNSLQPKRKISGSEPLRVINNIDRILPMSKTNVSSELPNSLQPKRKISGSEPLRVPNRLSRQNSISDASIKHTPRDKINVRVVDEPIEIPKPTSVKNLIKMYQSKSEVILEKNPMKSLNRKGSERRIDFAPQIIDKD
jgi:hypothetical protein